MLTDDEFLRRFEAASLSEEEFDHRAHVRMAWLYLRAEALPGALAKICDGIRRFATAHGVPGLYHETITIGFALLIVGRIGDGAGDWDSFAEANADLFEHGLAPLRRFYREETLASPAAKQRFVWPDRLG